jgi:hypothetical protein
MPTAHGLLLPPVNASTAGKVPSLQKTLFEGGHYWAPDIPAVWKLLPQAVLDQLVDFNAKAAAAAAARASTPPPPPPPPNRPAGNAHDNAHDNGAGGAAVRVKDEDARGGGDSIRDADAMDDSIDSNEPPCTWEPSPSSHMLAGRVLQQMRRQSPVSPSRRPPSPIAQPDTSMEEEEAEVNAADEVEEDSSAAADGEVPAPSQQPGGEEVDDDVGVEGEDEDEAEAEAHYPPSTTDSAVPQSSGWSSALFGGSVAAPMTLLAPGVLKISPQANETPTSAQPRPVVIPYSPSLEPTMDESPELRELRDSRFPIAADDGGVVPSSYSPPCAKRVPSVEPPLRTSQSSPSGSRRLVSPTRPAELGARSFPLAKPLSREALAGEAQPSPTPNSRSRPFDLYCLAYPDYAGSLASFVQACECLIHYQQNLSAPEFLFDDLVRVFDALWLPYARRQRRLGKDAIALVHYYNAHVQTPVYTRGVLGKSLLAVVVPDVEVALASRVLLAASADGFGTAPLAFSRIHDSHQHQHQHRHSTGLASTASFDGVVSHLSANPAVASAFEAPVVEPVAAANTLASEPPTAAAATTATTTTTTTTTAMLTTTTNADMMPVSSVAAAAPARPGQLLQRVPSLAGSKRRASSPSGSVASRRRSMGPRAAATTGAVRPPLAAALADPAKATPGTAAWGQRRSKKSRAPGRDVVVASQQSRV